MTIIPNGREIRFYAAFLLDGDEWGYGKDKREVEVYYGGDETIPAEKTAIGVNIGGMPAIRDTPCGSFSTRLMMLQEQPCTLPLGSSSVFQKFISTMPNARLS